MMADVIEELTGGSATKSTAGSACTCASDRRHPSRYKASTGIRYVLRWINGYVA